MMLPIPDRRTPSTPIGDWFGLIAPGYTQDDDYSCGAVSAYTALQLRRHNADAELLPLSHYRKVYDTVKPDPDDGAEWHQLRRALVSARYGKFREASVMKAIREGHAVVAAIDWPTDILHYVTITACDGMGRMLVLNLAGNPGKSWAWQSWDELRPGADDTVLFVPL